MLFSKNPLNGTACLLTLITGDILGRAGCACQKKLLQIPKTWITWKAAVFLSLAAKTHHFCAFYCLTPSILHFPAVTWDSEHQQHIPKDPGIPRKCPKSSPCHGQQLQPEGKHIPTIPQEKGVLILEIRKNKWLQASIISTSAQQDA